MPGYLDNYGVSEAKHEKKVHRILLIVLAVVVAAGGIYLLVRDYREKRQIARFFDLLRQKQYQDAYRMWGCDPAKPCRDYNFEKFLSDWGPQSSHADLSRVHIRRTRSCDGGVIQIVDFAPNDEVLLYVDRQRLELSFSPFEYCMDASGRNTKLIDIFFR